MIKEREKLINISIPHSLKTLNKLKKFKDKMEKIEYLKKRAKDHRKQIIDLAVKTGHSHLGGSLSIVEILISLYDEVMNEKDKFVLSKGHSCLGFELLLKEKGFSPSFIGHPDIDKSNGIHCTTGSLGHGLPIGVGMAFARKFLNQEGHIYVLLGDGECQEGTIWESLLLAKRFKLNNLTVIVDHNKLQALGKIDNFSDEDSLKKKFSAFGFNTFEIDGNDFTEVFDSLNTDNVVTDIPRAIISHTIKGKGVSFMENDPKWHTRLPNEEEVKIAYGELE